MLTTQIERKNYENDLILTVIYLKPNTGLSELSKTFQEYFEKITLKTKQMHLMCGDLNIDQSKTNAKFLTLENILGGYDLNNVSLTGFTRETINSQTRTNIVYCSQEVKVEVLKSKITDHYTVKTELAEETEETGSRKEQYYRHWAILEKNSVLEKLVFKLKHKLQGFQDNFCLLDCNSSFEKSQQTIIDEIKHYVPEKKSKALRHKSWIDNSIKNLAAKKQKLYQRYMQQKTNDNKKRFNKIRKLLQKKVLKKRRNFYQTFLFRNAKRTTKTLFKTIKRLGGESQKKQQATLTQEETENFNKFFTTIGKKLADKLVTKGENNTKNRSVNSMFLNKISEKELSVAIRNLENKYSSVFDGLNNFIIKKIQFAIVPTLTYLVNKCFENSVFPNCLKEAVIIPLYRKGDPKVAENYRPISLLPTIGKLIEKLVQKRMLNFLEKFKLLNKNQFVFRPKKCTVEALVSFIESVRQDWEDGITETKAVFIDLKKSN